MIDEPAIQSKWLVVAKGWASPPRADIPFGPDSGSERSLNFSVSQIAQPGP
jgi:hypothetical protein